MFDLEALAAELADTIFAGNLHFEPVTGSTNTDAMAAARLGAPHGSVYVTDEQTAGRGRGDHRWDSNAGQGLYVSVLLRLALPTERLQLLPLAAGLASVDAIAHASGLRADLRWPNDLMIGDRKTGGILVESKIDGTKVVFAVVGIGINVHQRSFPEGLATPATSLDVAAGRMINRQALLLALLESLEREAHALTDKGANEEIPARMEMCSTWVRGRRVEVHGPQACVGVTAGLDENGFLIVRTANTLVTIRTGGLRDATVS